MRITLSLVLLVAASSLGCSNVKFAAKQDVLKKVSVFGDEHSGGPEDGGSFGSGGPEDGGSDEGGGGEEGGKPKYSEEPGGTETGMKRPPEFPGFLDFPEFSGRPRVPTGPEVSETPTDVPVKYLCSMAKSQNTGYNAKTATSLEVQLVDKKGAVVCKYSDGVKESLLNKKVVPLRVCPGLTEDSYTVQIIDPSKRIGFGGKDLLGSEDSNPRIIKDVATGKYRLDSTHSIFVLYDTRDFAGGGPAEACDLEASPLIINTSSDQTARGIDLTAPLDGIFFDILGERSFPRRHTKKQISWLRNSDFMFLAKPDLSGRVNGINELFGDNTRGPDGKFSADGYAALAKYDVNKDHVIDRLDPVYTELRLWSDSNLDGVSQPHELIRLNVHGLEAIDLEADHNYVERDIYGNETRLKSVVRYSDGSLKLIFDLWFRYL